MDVSPPRQRPSPRRSAPDRIGPRPYAVLAVLATATAGCGSVGWALGVRAVRLLAPLRDLTDALTTAGAVRVQDVVELVAVLIGAGIAAWFALALAAASACAGLRAVGGSWTAGERLVARAAPVVVRRGLALGVGTGVTLAALSAPAVATPDDSVDDLGWSPTVSGTAWPTPTQGGAPTPGGTPTPAVAPTPGPTSTSGAAPEARSAPMAAESSPGSEATASSTPAAELPGAATVTFPARAPAAGPAPPAPSPGVVVRPGDTLWDIAAAHLPADATTADIAAAWPDWYAANHRVIGPDPDLLLPGQRLVAPGTDTASGATTGADS